MTYGHLHITMILPRRTRDKHRESTLKRGERLPSIINAGAAGAPRWLINDKFTPDSEQCIASIETAVRRKTFFVRPVFFNSKMITLPRQARDKHTDRKHSQKNAITVSAGWCAAARGSHVAVLCRRPADPRDHGR
jgi:hypothetical protein